MNCQTNRRGFLKRAALPAAGWMILGSARSARSYQANEKLNVAVVGVGKRGRWHVSIVPRVGQNLVALCDANHQRAADTVSNRPGLSKDTATPDIYPDVKFAHLAVRFKRFHDDHSV